VLVALLLTEHRVKALVEVLVGAAPGVVNAHRIVGGDRAVEKAPVRTAGVLGTEALERPTLAPLGEDLVLLGDEVGFRADGSEHRASAGVIRREPASALRRGAGNLDDGRRASEYPTLRCSASRRLGRARDRRSSPPSSLSFFLDSVMPTPGPISAPWVSPLRRS